MSSPAAPEPYVVEDCRGVMQVMSDATVRRSADAPFTVEIPDDDCGVEWKDVTWDPEHDLNVRMYRPRRLRAANDARIPVLAYFHGGGFCIGSCRWPTFHASCLRLASSLPAVVLSFDYRLAPEDRLPAAHEDGAKALAWLRDNAAADPWFADAADFSRVFVAGDSAGGNIAHHMAAKIGKTGLSPGRLRGHVLLWPAMAGEARTRTEQECPAGAFLTIATGDKYCRLSLPEGATRDHPTINPAGPQAPGLGAVEMAPVLVLVGESDMLRERNAEYARRMKEWGKDVEYVELDGVEHGFFSKAPWSERADELVRLVRRFVVEHMDSE